MKKKLKKFSDFAMSLFPHEVEYLLSIQQFDSPENISILNKIALINSNTTDNFNFDTSIDKRRYSNIKKWIEDKLSKIDVDVFLNWLLDLDKKILTDSISLQEEKNLLQKVKQIQSDSFYFIRFYEMIQHYRDYLLIRVRKQYYKHVVKYLNDNYLKYTQAFDINRQLNLAAKDIVQLKKVAADELLHWENFLRQILNNKMLNGDTRYKALIRLSLYYYKKQDFSQLKELYISLGKEFASSAFYSKRILANYYANLSLVLAKTGETRNAEKYAYLSIKVINNDYLFYINNLIYILHEQKKYQEAVKIASSALIHQQKSNSFYNRIGFTALYIRTLNNTGQSERAVSFGHSFFEAYKKEIFEYRWHLFFSSFFEALMLQEKYSTIISYCNRFQLIKLEKNEQNLKSQNNVLYWFLLFAKYMTAKISETTIKKAFQLLLNSKHIKPEDALKLKELKLEFKTYFPSFIRFFAKTVPQEEFIF